MKFVVRETGEIIEVPYIHPADNAEDCAADIAIYHGLFADGDVKENPKTGRFIASEKTVEYWQEYFKKQYEIDDICMHLELLYPADEIKFLREKELVREHPSRDYVLAALSNVRRKLEERYSIETARLIAEYDPYPDYNDPYFSTEALYQQNTGEFFLFRRDGVVSCYDEDITGDHKPDHVMYYSLTPDAAKVWVRRYSDAKTYTEVFGPGDFLFDWVAVSSGGRITYRRRTHLPYSQSGSASQSCCR